MLTVVSEVLTATDVSGQMLIVFLLLISRAVLFELFFWKYQCVRMCLCVHEKTPGALQAR